jgi:hypothetical protein
MKAGLRAGTILVAAALAVAPAAVAAQSASTPPASTPPTANSAAPKTIGPSELQNFNLRGTVTRPADQVPVTAPATPRAAPPSRSPQTRSAGRAAPAQSSAARPNAAPRAATASSPTSAPQTIAAPPVQSTPTPVASAPTPAPVAFAPTVDASPTERFDLSRLSLWPWIAAALALAAGAGFLLRRRWSREVAAAGPQFDLLVAGPSVPEPQPRAPAPAPSAAPPPERASVASGTVASRLRPALEIGFHPLRCQVDDDQVAIEFELELFNAGAAPARAVLAEASLLNAGATQEHDLAVFFANPHGVGERLDLIPPMKRVSFRSQVVAPRAAVQEYELAGRKSFVPVIAFNALYEWSGGKAQSSAAYLVGRDTQQDKLGPLRLDRGAREYHGLGARPLPSAVRT